MSRHFNSSRVLAAIAVAAVTTFAGMSVPTLEQAGMQSCRASNLSNGQPPDRDLQSVIQTAHSGDSIRVTGTCRGRFVVTRSIKLIGKSTKRHPDPTLLGSGHGPVVNIRGLHSLASVTGNTAVITGGGINPTYISGFGNVTPTTVFVCNATSDEWTGTISANTPDDPPPTSPTTCSWAPVVTPQENGVFEDARCRWRCGQHHLTLITIRCPVDLVMGCADTRG